MRKFLYTPMWTIPIDEIKKIAKHYDPKDQCVAIYTTGATCLVRSSFYADEKTNNEIYEDIQRQLMEGER